MKQLISTFFLSTLFSATFFYGLLGCSGKSQKDPRLVDLEQRYATVSVHLFLKCKDTFSQDSFRVTFSKALSVSIDSAETLVETFEGYEKNLSCPPSNMNRVDGSAVVQAMIDSVKLANQTNLGDRIKNFPKYEASMEGLGLIQELQEDVSSALGDPERSKQANQWKTALKSLQQKHFPKLRKMWADELSDKLWKSDIEVNLRGTTLEFVGGTFAANANIAAMQEEMSSLLTQFRFKRVNYKWYSGADEYQYYKIDSPNDSEL